MRAIQRLISIAIISISITLLACVSASLAFIPTETDFQKQGQFQPKPEIITAEIPHNPNQAKQEASYPNTPRVVFLDHFAWQVFAALNWPADCQQGSPLASKKIGEAPDAPRVWEFYSTPETVFVSGKTPSTPNKPFICLNAENRLLPPKNSTVKLTEQGKLDAKGQNANPQDLPLIDQQGNYIIVETYINPQEFNQIVKNKWYDSVNLAQFNNDNNQFDLICSGRENDNILGVPCSTYEKEGAIEIKASWRVFDEQTSKDEKARYYTTKRKVLIPGKSDKCDTGKAFCSDTGEEFSQVIEVGLIGFHIKHKTSEQGWIWSTFEQVDNVPDGTLKQNKYTLNNPDCQKNCVENTPYVEPPYLWRKEAPHAVTKIGGEIKNQIPSQIVRSFKPKSPLDSQISEQNQQWHQALKDISKSSVWQYYNLVGTQWLTNPSQLYNEQLREITPKLPLANVTLEPYIQNSSCIGCHTGAKLRTRMQPYADFTFQMARANSSNGTKNVQ
ncbi:hypothetical protein FNW02_33155 [Komarekiella sp. 'clone 1']|uniref:Cytochrome c family protein n=1 Tax=Komarekiella delphini-convector SJRDD-AB1 TaxID=2593771 RepID=A0AA40VUR5_9NOST|nr:hypothetical protein [Komarekiella delphini-convector]MBD6620502.1 hypothetical protein [Komarekiella delphini-convector SJRDD-AB1]